MRVFLYFFTLVMVQLFEESNGYGGFVFGRTTGKVISLEGTRTGFPKVSISDDNSIRLQFYGRRRKSMFWCTQVVSIEQKRGQLYEELDTATISCTNVHRQIRGLTKKFINFGNSIFLEVKRGDVIATFVLPSGVCTEKTYSNKVNGVQKIVRTLNIIECRKMINVVSSKSLPNIYDLFLITPENTEGPETLGPTYLPTKVGPNTVSPLFDTEPVVFYFTETSPQSRAVNLAIHALGIPVLHKTVNLAQGEHFSPQFEKLNPLRTVPAIDDGGFILWESHAIMTYLVSQYGIDDSLYPRDLKQRGIVDQRLHYSNDVFYAFKEITKPLVFLRTIKKPDENMLTKVREHQENVEKLLVGNKFMAGDSLTVADFSFVTIMDLLEIYSPTGDKYPLTKAWFERCRSSMKDFEEANEKGAEIMRGLIKQALAS